MNEDDRKRIDSLNDKLDQQYQRLSDQISELAKGQARLTGIVTNGLSHRVQENHKRIGELIQRVPTRDEVSGMVQGCYEADAAQDARASQHLSMGERRKGNRIALWSVLLAGLSMVATIVVSVGV